MGSLRAFVGVVRAYCGLHVGCKAWYRLFRALSKILLYCRHYASLKFLELAIDCDTQRILEVLNLRQKGQIKFRMKPLNNNLNSYMMIDEGQYISVL